MRFCDDHWSKLRSAIVARGLGPLISHNATAVSGKFSDLFKSGIQSLENFDPLLSAHNLIVLNGLDVAGYDLLENEEDGSHRCPLCYLVKQHEIHCTDPNCPQDYEAWVEKAADDANRLAEELLTKEKPNEQTH